MKSSIKYMTILGLLAVGMQGFADCGCCDSGSSSSEQEVIAEAPAVEVPEVSGE